LATRSALTPWIPVILWIAVIVGLGSSAFQHDQTSRFIGPILRWLFPDWSDARIAGLHGLLRKSAHLMEYAIAAVLAYRARQLGARGRSRAALALPALGLVACVALADEGRQATIESRTGSPRDVALDVTGGVLGLGAAPFIVRRRNGSGARREPGGPRERRGAGGG